MSDDPKCTIGTEGCRSKPEHLPVPRDRDPECPVGGFAVLIVLFAIPSLAFIDKYFGSAGIAGYMALVGAAFAAIRYLERRWSRGIERFFWPLVAAVFLGLVVVFAIGYPMESARGFGHSSDRDDGLNLAVELLVAGKFPYYPAHETIGPLSLLPGAIFLGTPFALMGNSAFQNFFWLAMFLGTLCRWLSRRGAALLLFVAFLGLCPVAQYEFISGGDMIANGIYVPVLLLVATRQWAVEGSKTWSKWASALALGMALASRANFLLLLPLIGGWMWGRRGSAVAFYYSAIVGGAALLLILPFYLHSPEGFTPLMSKNKLALVDATLPWASRAIIAGTVVLAVVGGLILLSRRRAEGTETLFRWATAVLLFPILAAVVFASLVAGHPNFGILGERFGLMYLPSAILAWGVCCAGNQIPSGMSRQSSAES